MGKFRFIHCGEYGDENGRPHYHALLFGLDFSDDRVVWKKNHRGERLYRSQVLEETWGKGHCLIGDVSFESAAYVARYVNKKVTGSKEAAAYGERKPPYMTSSRRPGIGATWFEKYRADVYPHDEVIIEGRRFRPPRFYDERLSEEELESYKRRRLKAAAKLDSSPEQLRREEKWLEKRIAYLRRCL